MAITTRSARITGPVTYLSSAGKSRQIPIGPCLVEQGNDDSIDIVWGPTGGHSAALPPRDVDAAQLHGHLVMLD